MPKTVETLTEELIIANIDADFIEIKKKADSLVLVRAY